MAATTNQFRVYATWARTNDLFERYNEAVRNQDLEPLSQYTRRLLAGKPRTSEALKEIRAISAPSLDWTPTIVGTDTPPDISLDELVIAYAFDTDVAAEQFVDFVVANQGAPLDVQGNAVLEVGADPGGDIADHWCPGRANRAMFRHRESARKTVSADALKQHMPALTGQRVNVVIIDQGLDRQLIQSVNRQTGVVDWGLTSDRHRVPRTG